MRLRVTVVTCALILTIAACNRHDPVADNANGAALPAPSNDTTPDPAGLPPRNATAPVADASPAPAVTIPAPLQGRWGLTPADCTSTRGDAKGLLMVTPDRLIFYESRAFPSTGVESDGDSISGNFDFTGEGQAWSKYESLKRDRDKLTRTETNPAASYTYAKC
ncbi:MAG TPA: hypothetical protein VG434_06435 [Sphingomicrobium sp.]|nr:hypothetical protein [Sphingomicrobium sp.]